MKSSPYTTVFFFGSGDVYHFVHKQRKRFPFFQEQVGEGLTVVGIEKAGQQSVEGMVVGEDGHFFICIVFEFFILCHSERSEDELLRTLSEKSVER